MGANGSYVPVAACNTIRSGGKRIVTVVPMPNSLCRSNEPPCNSTNDLVSGRPSPEPAVERAFDLTERGQHFLHVFWGNADASIDDLEHVAVVAIAPDSQCYSATTWRKLD